MACLSGGKLLSHDLAFLVELIKMIISSIVQRSVIRPLYL